MPSSAPRCRSSARSCARRSTCAPGQRVLDVAAGNGNASLAAARRWCEVVATDYVPALLERARERAAAERLDDRVPRGRRRSAAVRRRQLRRRGLDLRRDVHARPGPRRGRAAPRLQARRQDRPRQLDAGGLHRPALQDHRQARAAAGRRQVAGAVGHARRGSPSCSSRTRRRSSRRSATSCSATARRSTGWRCSDLLRPVLKAFAALKPEHKPPSKAISWSSCSATIARANATLVLPSDYLEVVITRR